MNEPSLNDPDKIRKLVDAKVGAEKAEFQQKILKEPQFSGKEIFQALSDNEDGDAHLYIKIHQGLLCFDHAANRWYTFKKHFWQEDLIDQVTAAIQRVINIYALEAQRQAFARLGAEKVGKKEAADGHKAKEEALLKRIRTLQTKKRKENVLHLAKVGESSLGITGFEWDRDPWVFGCNNGIIDLKTGKHRPGKPQGFIKTAAPTKWEGLNAPCSTWEQTLFEIFDQESELVEYLQRLLGYGITGETLLHVVVFLWGIGRNGKGTILETLKSVLGDLAYKAESELLLDPKFAKQSGAPNSGILALRGKRIIWASETGQGRKLNAARIKELVGGDTLNARAPYGKRHIEFRPSHLLLLLTNHKPYAPASDYALWERLHLIPFPLSFVSNPTQPYERKMDPELLTKLKKEAPGILAWLVRGCLKWQKEGLNPPELVMTAVKEYRAEEDILGHFLKECCVFEPIAQVKAGKLYEIYKQWCLDNGHKHINGTRFGNEMKSRFNSYKTNYIYYEGVKLADND